MYMRYLKTSSAGRSSYRFAEKIHLFGCNNGFIPWLLERRISPSQGEPFKWHIPIGESLNGVTKNNTDCNGSALIIDLKPKQNKNNLSLYELEDVWGYSNDGWSPILLRLCGLFVDADPKGVDREKFAISDTEREGPIYEFMYLTGSVKDGKLDGSWNAPPASPTNAALLWPEALTYFFESIRRRTPDLLSRRETLG